jgi:hypothetical protein
VKGGRLTGTDLTDPAQVGADKACTLEDPSVEALAPVKVVDCRNWTLDAWRQSGARPVSIEC